MALSSPRDHRGHVRLRRRCGPESGFTYIELVIVLTVLVLLAAITVPGAIAAQGAMQIHSAPFSMASKVGEARTNALKRNQPAWVLFDTAAGTAQVQTTGPTGTVNIGPPEFLPANVVFNLGGAPTATITFDSMGRPAAPPQSIVLLHANSGVTRTVTVSATGRITVN